MILLIDAQVPVLSTKEVGNKKIEGGIMKGERVDQFIQAMKSYRPKREYTEPPCEKTSNKVGIKYYLTPGIGFACRKRSEMYWNTWNRLFS